MNHSGSREPVASHLTYGAYPYVANFTQSIQSHGIGIRMDIMAFGLKTSLTLKLSVLGLSISFLLMEENCKKWSIPKS
jgi:hypothetical protein